jgi:rubrerythrin
MEMIAITTMDSLPELCYECPLHDGENGQCNADKEKRYSAEYRPYWCPLKDVDLNNTGGEAETGDREKVIHGLEIQLDDLQKYADNDQPLTLTQEQAQEIISLLKEQKANGAWEFVCHNPSYSPFDNSPSSLYRCTNCRYTTGSMTKYCPMCGSKNQQ